MSSSDGSPPKSINLDDVRAKRLSWIKLVKPGPTAPTVSVEQPQAQAEEAITQCEPPPPFEIISDESDNDLPEDNVPHAVEKITPATEHDMPQTLPEKPGMLQKFAEPATPRVFQNCKSQNAPSAGGPFGNFPFGFSFGLTCAMPIPMTMNMPIASQKIGNPTAGTAEPVPSTSATSQPTKKKRGRPKKCYKKEDSEDEDSWEVYLPEETDADMKIQRNDFNDCFVCSIYEGRRLIKPCGHYGLCVRCARLALERATRNRSTLRCPYQACNKPIKEFVVYFYVGQRLD